MNTSEIEMLNNIIEKEAFKLNINMNHYNIDDCTVILNKSKELNDILDVVFQNKVNISEIEKQINCSFLYDVISLYITINELEVSLDKDLEQFSSDLTAKKLYYRDTKNSKILTQEEEIKLFTQYKNGSIEARDKIIYNNQKLVASIAKKYAFDEEQFNENIQNGNLGLIFAVQKFDINKGYRFLTYAKPWITSCIKRKIDSKVGIFNINNSNAGTIYKKYNLYKYEYFKNNGHYPSQEELIKFIKTCNPNLSNGTIKSFLQISPYYSSLNQQLSDDESTYFDIVSSNVLTPEEEYLNSHIKEELNEYLSILDERSKYILCKHWGVSLNNECPECLTLGQIGEQLNITPERVRQLELKAFKKIRMKNSNSY